MTLFRSTSTPMSTGRTRRRRASTKRRRRRRSRNTRSPASPRRTEDDTTVIHTGLARRRCTRGTADCARPRRHSLTLRGKSTFRGFAFPGHATCQSSESAVAFNRACSASRVAGDAQPRRRPAVWIEVAPDGTALTAHQWGAALSGGWRRCAAIVQLSNDGAR